MSNEVKESQVSKLGTERHGIEAHLDTLDPKDVQCSTKEVLYFKGLPYMMSIKSKIGHFTTWK